MIKFLSSCDGRGFSFQCLNFVVFAIFSCIQGGVSFEKSIY